MNLLEKISTVEEQEKMLRFPHFDRKDAWELGQLMVSRTMREKIKLSIGIRLAGGLVIFQYLPEGTTSNNESWMTRKVNVVRELEISSLLNALRMEEKKLTLESKGWDPRLYAAAGGGFPIHVAGTGVIGAVVVSGQFHLVDHDLIVEGISRFLDIKNVPRIPADA